MMDDILVIGAGPVGATFALLAKARGCNVALMDARHLSEAPDASAAQQGARVEPAESRSLALSHGSRVILARAGAWQSDLNATEIHNVHTSQQGGFGRLKLSREDANVPALGYVISYGALQSVLDDATRNAQMTIRWGCNISAIERTSNGVSVTYIQAGDAKIAEARMIVLADGGANLAKLGDTDVEEKDYGQSALLAKISSDARHHHVAYERFTPDGPLALLPYSVTGTGTHDYAMVWVDTSEKTNARMGLSDNAVLDEFQAAFGTRAGKFLSLSARQSYPLKLRQSQARVALGNRVAIIGNAAQAMHPVAGQGFNLGLRDADTLAKLVGNEAENKTDYAEALSQYDALRVSDVRRGVGLTDLLASAFLTDHVTLRVPRGFGLAMIDLLPSARKRLANVMLFGSRR